MRSTEMTGVGALTISFSKPPTNVADAYAADGAHDMYMSVKPTRALSKAEEEELISAVRDTSRAVGALSCESLAGIYGHMADLRASLSGSKWSGDPGGAQAFLPFLEE